MRSRPCKPARTTPSPGSCSTPLSCLLPARNSHLRSPVTGSVGRRDLTAHDEADRCPLPESDGNLRETKSTCRSEGKVDYQHEKTPPHRLTNPPLAPAQRRGALGLYRRPAHTRCGRAPPLPPSSRPRELTSCSLCFCTIRLRMHVSPALSATGPSSPACDPHQPDPVGDRAVSADCASFPAPLQLPPWSSTSKSKKWYSRCQAIGSLKHLFSER